MTSNADRVRLEPAEESRPPDMRRIVYVKLAPSENPVLMELPGSTPIRSWLGELLLTAGKPMPGGCAGAGFRLETADGRRMNPAGSLAQSGVGNGATLILQPADTPDDGADGGHSARVVSSEMDGESDAAPEGGENRAPVSGASLVHASGLVIDLDPLPAVIGRASRIFRPEIDLSALDRRSVVSRKHARIVKKESAYMLRPEATTNGTFVNGAEITPGTDRVLMNGDRLLFGYNGVELVFQIPGA